MKKSDFDFTIPRRQSWKALILILWNTYKIIFRQVLPIVLIGLIGRSDYIKNYIIVAIAIVTILGLVYSIIAYLRFKYQIQDEQLKIKKGVLNVKKTSIDFDRIQTINFEQNILHRVLNVVQLKIDTAGSSKNEFILNAVEIETGKSLRDQILSYKEIDTNVEAPSTSEENTQKNDVITKLGFFDLIRAGLVENHIRSGGLIVAFAFYIYNNLRDYGVDVEEYTDRIDIIEYNIGVILILVVVFLVISILISLIRMILVNFNLIFSRQHKGFKITAGFFTQRMTSILDQKIQRITWSNNLLKKALGIYDLKIEQAQSEQLDLKKSIKIPSCTQSNINKVIDVVFPLHDSSSYFFAKTSKHWAYRQSIFVSIIPLIIILVGLHQNQFILVLIAIALLGLFIIQVWLKYKKLEIGINSDFILIKGGMYGDKNLIFPKNKIQAIKLIQSPYMRRKGLSSIIFYHASGISRIPFIHLDLAQFIRDDIMFRIENTHQKWM